MDRFFQLAEASGGASGYQTLINAALREYLDGKTPRFDDAVRRIIREELKSSAAWLSPVPAASIITQEYDKGTISRRLTFIALTTGAHPTRSSAAAFAFPYPPPRA